MECDLKCSEEKKDVINLFEVLDSEKRQGASLIYKSDSGGRILLGGIFGALEPEALLNIGVTHILTMAQEINLSKDGYKGIKKLKLDISDTLCADLDSFLDKGIGFIKNALSCNGTVYVHCYQGKSRSVAIILAAMLKLKLSPNLKTALKTIKRARKKVEPNPNFMVSLFALEESLLGEVSIEKMNFIMPKTAVTAWMTRDETSLKFERWKKYQDRFTFNRRRRRRSITRK